MNDISPKKPSIIFILLILLTLGFSGYVVYQNVSIPKEVPQETTPFVENEPKISEPSVEQKIVSDLKIKFSEKFDKNPEEVILVIDSIEEDYAKGGVRFEGEMGGGYFLTAKVNGEWVIVFDGNGTVPCENLEIVDYPVSLMSQCWDEENMILVERN